MKPTAMTRFLFCAVVALGPYSSSNAQTVYRCGPNGNQYSQQACPQGKPINVADPRSAEQVDEARKSVIEQRKLGYLMAKERREEERAHTALAAGNLGPRPGTNQPKLAAKPKKPSSKPRSGKAALKAAGGSEFTAFAPATPKKKRAKAE